MASSRPFPLLPSHRTFVILQRLRYCLNCYSKQLVNPNINRLRTPLRLRGSHHVTLRGSRTRVRGHGRKLLFSCFSSRLLLNMVEPLPMLGTSITTRPGMKMPQHCCEHPGLMLPSVGRATISYGGSSELSTSWRLSFWSKFFWSNLADTACSESTHRAECQTRQSATATSVKHAARKTPTEITDDGASGSPLMHAAPPSQLQEVQVSTPHFQEQQLKAAALLHSFCSATSLGIKDGSLL